jgi:hypothetical protein
MALRKAQMYYLQGFHNFEKTHSNEAAIANWELQIILIPDLKTISFLNPLPGKYFSFS